MTSPREKLSPVSNPVHARRDTILRRTVATIFAFAGTFKLLAFGVQVLAPQLNAPSFTALLQTLGVPFPIVFALAVPLLEVIGAICLWRNIGVRLVAGLLAIDMIGAIITVGWPAVSGRAPQIKGVAFGDEAWRLPLEIGLLGACVWLSFRNTR